MIDAQLYVQALADGKVTTGLTVDGRGAFQCTFAETDDLGNPITPVVQSALVEEIEGAIADTQTNLSNLQGDMTATQTLLTDQQTLLGAAQKAGAK